MLKLTTNTEIPSVESTARILQQNINDLGVPMDYDRMQEYYLYYNMLADKNLNKIIRYTGTQGKKAEDYKDSDFRVFIRDAGVREGLMLTGRQALSLSSESLQAAIATGLYSDEICQILKLYSDAKSCKATVSYFSKIFDEYTPCGVETFDNHKMIIVKPIVVPQNTGRIGYQHPAVTNFGRDIQDIFTYPKGWMKCECDSGQIDPRISQSTVIRDKQLMACTMLYNDAYFGYVHYCKHLTREQRERKDMNLVPMEITDEMREQRKKFKTYGNAAMYGSTRNDEHDPDKDLFIRYIGGHPNRVALQRDVEERIRRGQTVFYTAFGTPIDIMAGPSAEKDKEFSESEQFKRKVKRAINNPIQGAAADLMRYSVHMANNILMRKAPNSRILMYVHDAGKFLLHEDDYGKVIDELKEITSYQVEGWLPINSDYSEGRHVGDVEEFL